MSQDFTANVTTNVQEFGSNFTGVIQSFAAELTYGIIYVSGGGGAVGTGDSLSAAWGYVTGNINNQIDLMGMLSGKLNTSQTGDFYPRVGNPSGFLTGIDLSSYATTSYVSGNYYPRNNPSGYITGVNLSSYATISYVSGVSGNLNAQILQLNSQTGNYYSISNPSGYITGVNLAPYATIVMLSGASGSLQTQISSLLSQSGLYALKTETGSFITSSQTGVFYPRTNPSGYITGVDLSLYATIPYVTGVSGTLQTQISVLNSQTGLYMTAGDFYTKAEVNAISGNLQNSIDNLSVYSIAYAIALG